MFDWVISAPLCSDFVRNLTDSDFRAPSARNSVHCMAILSCWDYCTSNEGNWQWDSTRDSMLQGRGVGVLARKNRSPMSMTSLIPTLARASVSSKRLRGPHHIGNSPLIFRANRWTSFYMIWTSVMKELTRSVSICYSWFIIFFSDQRS